MSPSRSRHVRTAPAPTAFVSWAHGDDTWTSTIAEFVLRLRNLGGIDADIDLFHVNDPEMDWSRYGPHAIESSDFVLIAVSAAYRRAWENASTAHREVGLRSEIPALRGLSLQPAQQGARKLLIVVLPGATRDDIPEELLVCQRFDVHTIDSEGLEHLLMTIHGKPRLALKSVPLLPPRLVDAVIHHAESTTKAQRPRLEAPASSSRPAVDPAAATEPARLQRDAEFWRIVRHVALDARDMVAIAASGLREGAHATDAVRDDACADRFLSEYERLVGSRHPDDATIERAARIAAAETSWRDGLGVLLNESDVARLMNIDRADVAERAAKHEFIAVTSRDGSELFPAYQFQDGMPAASLARVHRTLVEDGHLSPWSAASWARTSHPELDFRSPARWVGEHCDEERLLLVARRDVARSAQ